MKSLLFLLTIPFSSFAYANEVSAVYSQISCIGKQENGLFKYKVGLLAKNTSSENLTLITKFSNVGVYNVGASSVNQVVFIDAGPQEFEGTTLIPAKSDLGLVELFPDEGAEINGFLYSSNPLRGEATVSIEIRDSYGGRYRNWEGIAKSKSITISNNEGCAL